MNVAMYSYGPKSCIPYIMRSNVWVRDRDAEPNRKEDVTILIRHNSQMGLVIRDQGKSEAMIKADNSNKGKEPVIELNTRKNPRFNKSKYSDDEDEYTQQPEDKRHSGYKEYVKIHLQPSGTLVWRYATCGSHILCHFGYQNASY